MKGGRCYGGASLPATMQLECGNEVTLRTSTIVAIVLFVLALLISAAGGVIFLYLRNKKLHHDYNMLVNQTVPMEESSHEVRLGLFFI